MNQSVKPELNSGTRINLQRPLVFFDLETTGVEVQTARIIELSAVKLHPDGLQERLSHVLNPGVHIPEGATAIHGFTDEDVADKPPFCEVAAEVCSFFTDSDLGGFNVRKFDIPLLMEEFHRCNMYPILLTKTKVVDVMSVYHKKETRTLSDAVRFYCDEELDNAHSAGADVEASFKVLHEQLQRYDDLSPDVHSLHSFCSDGYHSVDFGGKFARNEEGRIIFNFGKHKDKIVDFDDDNIARYVCWMKEEGSFSVDTLMGISRAKAHHNCHKACLKWLGNKELLIYPEHLQALQEALTSEKDVAPFSVSRDGKRLTLTFQHNQEPALSLGSDDDKLTMLFILRNALSKGNSNATINNMVAVES